MDPILHLSIPVADLDESRRFYVDALGCEVGRVRDGWLDVWFFGMQLTLQARPGEILDDPGARHFGVTLDPATLDELLTRLAAWPVRWVSQPTADTDGVLDGKTSAKVLDPSGNVIELKTYDDPTAFRTSD